MRGHVRERSPGAWDLRAYAGRDALSGKPCKTKTVRVRGRREAEKVLAASVTELETSGVAAEGTLGGLVERWIATAVPGWSPANEVTVRNTVSYYLAPLLPVKLCKLNTADLDAFYAALRNGGGRGGRPLAVSTVRRLRHSVGLDQVRLHDLRHFVATGNCRACASDAARSFLDEVSTCWWNRPSPTSIPVPP